MIAGFMIGSVSLLYKLQFLYFSMLIVAGLLIVLFFFSTLGTNQAQAKQSSVATEKQSVSATDDPNVITAGMFAAGEEIEESRVFAINTANNSLQAINGAFMRSGKFAAQSTSTLLRNVATGMTAVGRKSANILGAIPPAVSSGVGYVISVPGNAVKLVSNSAAITAVIRPADHAPVPIIDPNSPALHEALVAMQTPDSHGPNEVHQDNPAAKWPVHGAITTGFGVNHWPYQPTHTGIDISDGKPSGTTVVKPFKAGRVVETVTSNRGLGNHVIIDHGSGVTSVYAHLSSISVSVGQVVDTSTSLGLQGSTGLSTGPHLHFEIRVNGKAADPRNFISDHP